MTSVAGGVEGAVPRERACTDEYPIARPVLQGHKSKILGRAARPRRRKSFAMDVSKIGKKFSMRSIFQIKMPVRKKIVFHPPKIAMPSVKLLSFREKKIYTYMPIYIYKTESVGWPSHHYEPRRPGPRPPSRRRRRRRRGPGRHTLRPEQATGDERWDTEDVCENGRATHTSR